ncbi:MAG: hypothetical protein IEMM0008_0301 [bacterium]|nr:MAG: hypothetical protein IEMM0008_0301 [bacterium]
MSFRKKITVRWIGIISLCFLSAIACDSEEKSTSPKSLKQMTTSIVFDKLKWIKLPNGRQISRVYGDMKKGHHITYVKFVAGMKTPLHTHSFTVVGIMISGTARIYQPGQPETMKVLPPGSHWTTPGNVVHIDECLPGADCIFAVHQNGAFDVKPAK